MASLLERMNITPASSTAGPVRQKSNQNQRSSPYARSSSRIPKRDPDAAWTHDLYESSSSLSSRIDAKPNPPRVNINALTQRAIRDATGTSQQLSIKGASTTSLGNVVEVSGLVSGTTPEDVAAIFKRCGEITGTKLISGGSDPRIRLTFKKPAGAIASVAKFNNQPADGKVLSVTIVGATSAGTTLTSRLDANGLGLVREEGTVDIFMDSEDTSSKMRSDTLLRAGTDPRAKVLIAPPGADPADYIQAPMLSIPVGPRRGGGGGGGSGPRGRRGGGPRRGGGGRRGALESRMETD